MTVKLLVHPPNCLKPKKVFLLQLKTFSAIEFGAKNRLKGEEITFDIKPQPSFNKKFNLLADSLAEYKATGYSIAIVGDSLQHITKLRSVIEELDPTLAN